MSCTSEQVVRSDSAIATRSLIFAGSEMSGWPIGSMGYEVNYDYAARSAPID